MLHLACDAHDGACVAAIAAAVGTPAFMLLAFEEDGMDMRAFEMSMSRTADYAATVALYLDLRVRREGIDLQLLIPERFPTS